jgi:hypothetical protein
MKIPVNARRSRFDEIGFISTFKVSEAVSLLGLMTDIIID